MMSTPVEEKKNSHGHDDGRCDGHDTNGVNNQQPTLEALLCEALRRVYPFADSFFSAQEEIMNLPKGSMWKKDPVIIQAILERVDEGRKCAIRGKCLTPNAAMAAQEEATKNFLRVMEEQEKTFYNKKK